MQVICYDCYGTGEIGVTKDNRVIACETCGGHEDKPGTGRVDVVCAACAEKDAEIARLGAQLKKQEEDKDWLRECDVYAAFQEEIEKTDRLCAALNAALDALKAAPRPPWNFRPTIGWQGVYCDWYEAEVELGKGGGDDV